MSVRTGENQGNEKQESIRSPVNLFHPSFSLRSFSADIMWMTSKAFLWWVFYSEYGTAFRRFTLCI